jgi:ATPase subunit of ABC transporter with duplicated ATPase domains
VSLTVRRGERVAIIGPNGLGKSTLLKIAVERLAADDGRVRWGHETRPGYFPQDHREVLTDGEATPLTILEEACPGESPTFVRSQLGRVLFSGEEAGKQVRLLSGGECARLMLAKLLLLKNNVLVLDEPTNHLDIESIEGLLDGLKLFKGTMIFVSHDRHFVGSLATHVFELKGETGDQREPAQLVTFGGTYDEYLERAGNDFSRK